MEVKTKQKLAVLLSIIGSAGTITTAILTRKAAKKEQELVKKYSKQERSEKDIFKKVFPVYIPTLIFGGATIASIISSTILSRKAEASLTAMALLADQGWRKYKGQIKNKFGLDTHTDILKKIGKKESKKLKEQFDEIDDRQLYFEDHVGFFKADPEKFALAYSDLNQRLQIEDYGVSSKYSLIYDLLVACEADIQNKDLNIENLRWGWSAEYLSDLCGYVWVHMTMFDTETESGKPFKTIVWGEDPFLDPGNFGEVFLNKDKTSEISNFISAIPNKNQKAVIDYEVE